MTRGAIKNSEWSVLLLILWEALLPTYIAHCRSHTSSLSTRESNWCELCYLWRYNSKMFCKIHLSKYFIMFANDNKPPVQVWTAHPFAEFLSSQFSNDFVLLRSCVTHLLSRQWEKSAVVADGAVWMRLPPCYTYYPFASTTHPPYWRRSSSPSKSSSSPLSWNLWEPRSEISNPEGPCVSPSGGPTYGCAVGPKTGNHPRIESTEQSQPYWLEEKKHISKQRILV